MRYAFLKAATTMFSIALLTACHAQTPSKPERDLNAIVEIPFGIPSLNQTTTLRIPEGYIDRWVMGEKIESYPSSIQIHASGVELLPERADTLNDFKYPRAFTQIVNITLDNSAYFTNDKFDSFRQKRLSGLYYNVTPRCKYVHQSTPKFGLGWSKVDLSSCLNPNTADQNPANAAEKDLFYLKNYNGKYITSIRCLSTDFNDNGVHLNGSKISDNPMCYHEFVDEKTGIFLEIRYPRHFFSQWQALEVSALRVVKGFLSTSQGVNNGR